MTVLNVGGIFKVSIDNCKDLVRKGSHKSDPYVQVSYGYKKLLVTPEIGNTQFPVWKFEDEIYLHGKVKDSQVLTFTVWDKELLLSAFNGKVDIPLKHIVDEKTIEKTYKLEAEAHEDEEDKDKKKGDEYIGTIDLKIEYIPQETAPAGMKELNIENYKNEPIHGVLDFDIKEATKLMKGDKMGKSDPYVVCKITKHKITTTPVIGNTLYPVWKFTDRVVVKGVLLNDTTLDVEVRDKDMIGSDLIGAIAIPMTELMEKGEVGGNFPLYVKDKKGDVSEHGHLNATFKYKKSFPGSADEGDAKEVDFGDLQAKKWKKEGHKDYTK